MQLPALAIVALGVVGLPLVLVGAFKPYSVLPLGVVVWVVLVAVWTRARFTAAGKAPLTTHLFGGGAVIVALVSAFVNGSESTQHLLVDGDPAVYGMTGKWIAEHGTLNIPIHPEWFGNDPTINYMTNGFFLRPDGHHLYPQFFHLLPSLLAVADWFGGTRGLLLLNMVIGGFALLAFYAFAARMMRPLWALAAMITLSMTLPQVFFTRDTFSEIPSQFLIFAGLALLYDCFGRRCKHPGSYGLLAGLTLGGSTMVRIDAFAYIPPALAAVVVLALVMPRDDARRTARTRIAIGLAAGFVVTCAVAVADATFGSPVYAKSVTGQLIALSAMTIVVVAVGVALLARERVEQVGIGVGRLLSRLAFPIGAFITVGLLFSWLIRPYVQTAHETGVLDISSTLANMQRAEHVKVDPTRHYNEMSLRWLSWYLGPVTLTLGIIGFGYLSYRILRRRDLRMLPFLLIAGSVTAVYVYDPQIVPVQYWATRRFVPISLPALCLLAFFVVDRVARPLAALVSRSERSATTVTRTRAMPRPLRLGAGALAGALGIASLVTPIVLMQGHVRLVRAYLPMREVVTRLCAALQPTDTVLLVGDSAQSNGFVQTIETYCGNSTAIAGINTEMPNIQRMATAAAATGHHLVLMSSQQKPVDDSGKPLGITLSTQINNTTFDTEALSLTHRPDSDFKVPLPIFVTPAPLG